MQKRHAEAVKPDVASVITRPTVEIQMQDASSLSEDHDSDKILATTMTNYR